MSLCPTLYLLIKCGQETQPFLRAASARLGVSRPIYVNVDSPNLGFPYFNFLRGTSEEEKTPCTMYNMIGGIGQERHLDIIGT